MNVNYPVDIRDLDERLAKTVLANREAYRKFAEKLASMKKKPKIKVTKTRRPRELPATQGHVNEVRDELLSRISELEYRMMGRFKDVDARFNQVQSRFEQIDARFDQLDAKINKVLEICHKTQAEASRSKALYERMERFELAWARKFSADL